MVPWASLLVASTAISRLRTRASVLFITSQMLIHLRHSSSEQNIKDISTLSATTHPNYNMPFHNPGFGSASSTVRLQSPHVGTAGSFVNTAPGSAQHERLVAAGWTTSGRGGGRASGAGGNEGGQGGGNNGPNWIPGGEHGDTWGPSLGEHPGHGQGPGPAPSRAVPTNPRQRGFTPTPENGPGGWGGTGWIPGTPAGPGSRVEEAMRPQARSPRPAAKPKVKKKPTTTKPRTASRRSINPASGGRG